MGSLQQTKKGGLFVLSGPSGAGKGSVLSSLLEECEQVEFSVSATTRKPRPGEKDGHEYHFISEAEFQEGIREGRFLEWARVHNNYYGTQKEFIARGLEGGQNLILDIDVQGARQVKESGIDATFIFLAPPSLEALRERLYKRNTEDSNIIEGRLKTAALELKCIKEYDYLVINDCLQEAICRLKAIIIAEGCRVSRYEEGDLYVF